MADDSSLQARVASVACTLLLSHLSASAIAAPPGAAVFGAVPKVQSVALSPSGGLVAWAETGGDDQQAVVLDVASGRTVRRAPLPGDMKLRGVTFADDETLLIDVSRTHLVRGDKPQQYEFERTIAFDLADGKSRVLLMDDDARSWVTGASTVALRTSQPKTVIMSTWDFSATSARQNTGTRVWQERRDSGWTYDLFAVDVRTGRSRKLAVGTPYTADWVVDAAGQPVARSEWEPERPLFTILARRGGGWQEIHRLTGGSLSLQGLTGDGKSVVALGSDGNSGRSQLWAIALDGSGARALAGDAERDVVSVQLDPYSRQPIGAWLGGAEPEVRWFDEGAEKRFKQVARAFPNRSVELYGRSADGARMLARVGGPSTAPVYYLVDFGARKADIVGEAYPSLVDVPLGTMRATSYAARDGTRIPAYLTLPPGSDGKHLPLVVLPHGGPEAHDEFDFDWFAQYLATRGYAVLQPQFRGSTGFGDAHRRAGYGEWGGLMQDDVSDGVLAMVEQGVADAGRVCIVGASYGGYAALAGATLTPDLYACAVSINGIADLPSAVADWKSSRGEESDSYAYWRKSIGSMHDAKLAERSPARLAGRVEAPVLLLHAADDTVVPPRQSRAMAKALESAGKTHTFIELPGEDHWLSRSATRIRVLEETGRFVDTYLRK